MQVDGRSPGFMESRQKFMEGLPAALKVDGKCPCRTEISWKLMDGFQAAPKVDGNGRKV